MTEELKNQISKILLYDSHSETEESENNDIKNIEENSETESETSCECNEEICECTFKLNVITEETQIALEMV